MNKQSWFISWKVSKFLAYLPSNVPPRPCRYGILILVLEAIGATTTAIYGINHLWYTINEDILAQPMLPMHTAQSYHIRVLVPCYKESIQILQVRAVHLK